MKRTKNGGFTLLELLIVIAIIAILSVALVLVLNPAETLKKARDGQRISDLSTIKTAIGLYLTSVPSPTLDNLVAATATTTICTTGTTGTIGTSGPKIRYSSVVSPILSGTLTAGTDSSLATWTTPGAGTTVALSGKVDGTGWIPVDFTKISGGSPISNIPVDPVNTVAATALSTDLVYRYGCQNVATSPKPSYVYEIDAVLESSAYGLGGTDDKAASDGGDNSAYYETGTSLKLLPTGSVF